ncbi:MAG TPA: PhzF family phenazine biosynthesis protein [Phycisphaerales bacterium]|nr:PhzF family phenazine biosynthesis protein [Phycisphaerales bacterium]
MRARIFQVDAFTRTLFGGNPAAVVPLETWPSDETLIAIAAENNLAETAFLVPARDNPEADFHLRWCTPTVEVALCGHATLAAAWVLRNRLGFKGERVRFTCKSGLIAAAYEGDQVVLDFPRIDPVPCDVPPMLGGALGGSSREVHMTRQRVNADGVLFAVFASEAEVRALKPDFARLKTIGGGCVCATAPGDSCDFVSRFFAPGAGIDEDPVTGSTHCVLTPYWAAKLGRNRLEARQISPRGGELTCELRGERVAIGGHAAPYLEGTIDVPER